MLENIENYEAPAVEQELTGEELDREVLYAGNLTIIIS